jgi:hypothetical protein
VQRAPRRSRRGVSDMTTIARIVERFTMTLEAPEPGRGEWFLDYVIRGPHTTSKHLTASWLALNSLADLEINSVWECFGGMGAQALMVEDLFNRQATVYPDHVVCEYNPDAVAHLRRVLNPYIDVKHLDSYASTPRADLVLLDFGDLTAWKTREGQPQRQLMDRVFEGEPKAVLLTDVARRYLHLHRERYESLLGPGTCNSYPAYLTALLDRIEAMYGYRLREGYFDRSNHGFASLALVPSSDRSSLLQQTPDSPVGLQLL